MSLFDFAQNVLYNLRDEIENFEDGSGFCAIASIKLYEEIIKYYPESQVLFCVSEIRFPKGDHCYLEVDKHVLDITAEQFCDLDTNITFIKLELADKRVYNPIKKLDNVEEFKSFLRFRQWSDNEIEI